MTEIKVILDEGTLSDLSLLTQEERELLFDQMAKDNPSIPKVIFDSFSEMQNEMIREDAKLIKPDLKELLLRKIIQLGQNVNSVYNTIVIPVVPGFAAPVRSKAGGAIPTMKRMKPREEKRPDAPGAIKIRFDQQIFSITMDGMDYIVPPNEELDVVGVILNPMCQYPKIPDAVHKRVTAVAIKQPTVGERIVLGNYTYTTASKACDGYFEHPDYSITIGGETFQSGTRVLFDGLDEVKILRVLGATFDYLAYFEQYNIGLESARFIHEQLNAALDGADAGVVQKKLVDLVEYLNTPHPIDSVYTGADKPDIAKTLETLHNGKFSAVYNTALLADMDTRGFANIYYKALIKGKDDPAVKVQLDMYKERQSRKAFQNSIKLKLLDDRNKLNAYKIIIEKKLGSTRLAQIEQEIIRKPSITATAKNILDLLKPNERKPIELEYERKEKYIEAVLNNKCPHVKLYRQYRLARTDEKTRQYYHDLKKFFKNANADTGMLTCNNCNFDIMCPHMRDFTEMDLAGKFHTEIKAKLTKYIDKSVTKDSYYCKICGEMISSLEAFGDVGQVRDPSSTMNEELKNFMWGEMAILTKYLKFGQLVNVPQLITAMRDACYPYIFEIEKQILKSKTNSADEIKAKKRLFVTIYAFAYMIHLILSNRGRGDTEITFKDYSPKNPKNMIVDLIKHVLDIIILSRNVIIREIPGMTGDLIKNKLIEAYKSIQSEGSQVIVHSGEAEDLISTLMLDSVYKYYYTINLINDVLHGIKHKGKMDIVERVDEIMGDTIAKLEKSKDVFAKAKVPKFDKWNLRAFDEIKPMKSAQTRTDGKRIFDSAHAGYTARSFEIFDEKVKSRLYDESVYVDVSASGRGDISAPMDVRFREPFEKHRKKYLELEKKETELLKYRAMESAKIWTRMPGSGSRRWTRPQVSLGRLYDEDGNSHVWNVYVVERIVDGKQTRVELKSSDIAKSTESGTKFTDVIKDKKCSVCGILWSTIDTLDETKIHDSLNARHVISNFFRFYENRCPRGGLHDFGEGNKCSKCNIDSSYILNSTSKDAMNYYREYKAVYIRERDEFAMIDKPNVGVVTRAEPADYESEYSNWTFNFNLVLDLANKVKVNHRLISALGAVEKQEYSEVQSGAYIPPEAEERNDTRVYVVDTHIKNLITEYNQIRFFHRLVKPSMELSTIIDNSGINKHKISELGKKLPDIFNDYNNKFSYVQAHKKPREIVSFCIQSFCEMCLKIWSDGEKETEKLRHDFVNYFVKKILRAEELLSKPGHFNWSILYGDKDVREKESYDTNTSKDVEGETDREFEETEETEEDFGDTSKPFDTGFDVESDPDADPMEAEDDDNQWNVGESYGLS